MTRDYAKSLCHYPYITTSEIQKGTEKGFKTTLILLFNLSDQSNIFCCERMELEFYPNKPWNNCFSHYPVDRISFDEFENLNFKPISPEEYQKVYDNHIEIET